MDRELVVRRLSYIKQLYQIAIKQSQQHESISVFSVLSFHDSIEMFLKLLAEHLNINSADYTFLKYWDSIPTLTLKESMRNLNARRVNIKHKGLLPAKSEIEISRVNATDFFQQSCMTHFNIEFSEISLVDLIQFEYVKKNLRRAETELKNSEFKNCCKSAAIAFDYLIFSYEQNKRTDNVFHFDFGVNMDFLRTLNKNKYSHDYSEVGKLGEFIETVKQSIGSLHQVLKVTTLGIDYKEYLKFKILTPRITRHNNSSLSIEFEGDRNWNNENCQFCIDFVVDSSLKLQQFDFAIDSLITDNIGK